MLQDHNIELWYPSQSPMITHFPGASSFPKFISKLCSSRTGGTFSIRVAFFCCPSFSLASHSFVFSFFLIQMIHEKFLDCRLDTVTYYQVPMHLLICRCKFNVPMIFIQYSIKYKFNRFLVLNTKFIS